jgi:hypothetical protein
VERKRANQRRYVYSARRDPITHVDHGFYPGSWSEVFAVTGWRPSRAIVVHRSRLTDEAIRWLAEFHKANGGK